MSCFHSSQILKRSCTEILTVDPSSVCVNGESSSTPWRLHGQALTLQRGQRSQELSPVNLFVFLQKPSTSSSEETVSPSAPVTKASSAASSSTSKPSVSTRAGSRLTMRQALPVPWCSTGSVTLFLIGPNSLMIITNFQQTQSQTDTRHGHVSLNQVTGSEV